MFVKLLFNQPCYSQLILSSLPLTFFSTPVHLSLLSYIFEGHFAFPSSFVLCSWKARVLFSLFLFSFLHIYHVSLCLILYMFICYAWFWLLDFFFSLIVVACQNFCFIFSWDTMFRLLEFCLYLWSFHFIHAYNAHRCIEGLVFSCLRRCSGDAHRLANCLEFLLKSIAIQVLISRS